MLSRPTTDQVLDGLARELRETVLPDVRSESVRVALGMIDQLLQGASRRAAHEIAWMSEEIDRIVAAARQIGDDEVVTRRLAVLLEQDNSLHLNDVCARYDLASAVLSALVDRAFRVADPSFTEQIRQLVEDRSAREMEILGSLDLVGRG